MPNSTIEKIRITVLIEGVSFLTLLFIAMPLKYLADLPQAVKWVGWAHGLLFIILCFFLAQAFLVGKISFKRALMVFIASLIPFAPFVINHKLK